MSSNRGDTRRFLGAFSALAARRSAPSAAAPAETPPARAELCYLKDIEHRPHAWLWQDRLAAGALAVLSGDPGSGKTWVALAIAAALSNGHTPGSPAAGAAIPPCTVLYASTLDADSQLIASRFLSLGGDPDRLVLLRGAAATAAKKSHRPFGIHNTSVLEDAITRTGARLLIIDPLHSYLAGGDRHRAHTAARLFDNLAHCAEKHSCCILLVRHLKRRSKNTTAVELSSAVRTEFLVGCSPDAPGAPVLAQTKSNLGPLAPSLGYRILPGKAESAGEPVFQWTGPSELRAHDLQTDRPQAAGTPRRKEAAAWLRALLSKGPLSQGEVEAAAYRDGEAMMTVRRAKRDLGVISFKSQGFWAWRLPKQASAHDHGGGERII